MKAATPISTFWDIFTMTPVFMAASLMSAPAATTEPLVSRVPPSHAPATISDMPDPLGDDGLEDHHGDRADEHDGRGVADLLRVRLDRAAGRNGSGDAADRDRAREHRGELIVDLELLGDPEGEVPDHADHEDGLDNAVEAGLHDLAEEDAGAEDHEAGLDVELGPDSRLEPCRQCRSRC